MKNTKVSFTDKGKLIAATVLAGAVGLTSFTGTVAAAGSSQDDQVVDNRSFIEKNENLFSGLMRSASRLIPDKTVRDGVGAIDRGVKDYSRDARKSDQEIARQAREAERQAELERRSLETRLRAAEADTRRLQAELKLREANSN